MYNVGLAELCKVPTTEAATRLPKQLKGDGVIHLEWKIAKYKPEVVGVVGKEAWKAIFNVKMGRTLRDDEFHNGWQDEALWMGKVEEGNRTNQDLTIKVEPDLMPSLTAGIDSVPRSGPELRGFTVGYRAPSNQNSRASFGYRRNGDSTYAVFYQEGPLDAEILPRRRVRIHHHCRQAQAT